jgi:hypothetical protein
VEEVTWLSPIVVMPKKNGKFRICVDFKKLNSTTKSDPFPLPFTYEELNIVTSVMPIHFWMDILGTIKYP